MADAATSLLVFSGIVAVALPAWALIDLLQWSEGQWQRAQHDRLLWAALILLTWLPGTIAYAVAVRPRLALPRPRQRHASPGWYPDPRRAGHHRYHDGQAWTRFVVESR